MHDNLKLYKPPDIGTCEVEVSEDLLGPREYIYNLLPRLQAVQEKEKTPLFKLSLPAINEEFEKTRRQNKAKTKKTMGPPSRPPLPKIEPPEKRSDFIKKHTLRPFIMQNELQKQIKELGTIKASWKPGKRPLCCGQEKDKLPLRPTSEEIDKVEHDRKARKQINYIQRNAIKNVIAAKPGHRIPDEAGCENPLSKFQGDCIEKGPLFIDTRFGDKQSYSQPKSTAGLTKRYIWKHTYGRVPAYMVRRKSEIEAGREMAAYYANELECRTTDYLLTPQQREDVLNGLKASWDRANRTYLSMKSICDTKKAQAFKNHLENEMKNLEKDIEALKRHDFIFIEAHENIRPCSPVVKKHFSIPDKL